MSLRSEDTHEDQRPGAVIRFYRFLAENKRWWILPILLVMLLLVALVLLSGSGVAPFVYTLS